MFEISSVRHMYPEKAGFFIDRREGHRNYTFLHFHNRVILSVGGREEICEPHGMILIRPGVSQYFRSEEPLLHDWFHFAGDFDALPLSAFCPDRVFYPPSHGFVTRLVAEMETEFFQGGEASRLLADCKLKELFLGLDRELSHRDVGTVDGQTLEKFRYLRGNMFSSLERHHTVEELCRQVNLSPSRFFALYRKIFGTSPTADLILARVKAAKNRLAFSQVRIEELAAELGYENTTHFIRQFKSRVGMTPSEYRKKQRKQEELQ